MTRDLGDARYLPKFGQFLNGNFYYQTAADWMPTKATNGGTASFVATGSRWTVNLATNASSASGVRLGRLDRGYNDSALLAWSSTFTAFVYAEIWARTNAICRFVVTQTGTTEGIANYPTNRAVGIEFRGAANMEARLIAHNGTTATNGPWVSFNYGSIVYAYNTLFAVRHLTNGTVELYRNSTNVPSATITGGPTNGSSAGFVHVDYGMENSTNAADNSANMQNSVEWWGVEYD
jgi:membrane-bound inhibitor of C-type lysozyme